MSHNPTLQDAACDLLRCISFENYERFLANAENIIQNNRNYLSEERFGQINKLIIKAKQKNLNIDQKREHLLTASILLQNSYKISS